MAVLLASCGERAEKGVNPLLVDSGLAYGVVDFAAIEDSHFKPAFDAAIAELREEIAAITSNPAEPNFDNTVLALERAGSSLDRVIKVFSNISNTDSNDVLQELERDIYPAYTRELDSIFLNPDVFDRLSAVDRAREYLDDADRRLIELYMRDFVRRGARLDRGGREQIAQINAELAGETTRFAQNLLGATKDFVLVVTDSDRLGGLSEAVIASARESARRRGVEGWAFGLNRSVFEAFMTQAQDRELRRQLFDGYRLRAASGEHDNSSSLLRIVRLRAQRARLLGFDSHAHFALAERMAKTPQQAEDFLLSIWRPGLARAMGEYTRMQQMVGDTHSVEGHDWWHLAEKVRQRDHDLDDSRLKPYFALDAVQNGAFETAGSLFGLRFDPVEVTAWHPETSAFDVRNSDGSHLGLFITDMYARDSKRGGAWMSTYRDASAIDGTIIRPIVTNNLNLSHPGDGQPTLLTFDEVETLFHEFGHALHGLMTTQKYQYYSGVSGPRDYTEFPAQIMEHWAAQGQVLTRYARHYQTGEPIPDALIAALRRASTHNQGFRTTEFIAAALLDLRWHMLSPEQAEAVTDVRAFERKVLSEYGLPDQIEPRYRSPYFSHIFAGGYSAGYYSYLWSEILDADGFEAFVESGDIFNPVLAALLRKWVFEAGGRLPADELYRRFRGRDPDIAPLLRLRGLGGGS